MSSTVTVRNIDSSDKSWLKREAQQAGVSMEEFVRRLIREKPSVTKRRPKPSQAFARQLEVENGVELPPPAPFRFRPLPCSSESGE